MRHNYFQAIDKFKSAGFDVTKWLIDQIEMGYDLSIDYLKSGLPQILNENASEICVNCYLHKIQKMHLPEGFYRDIFKYACDQKKECIFCQVSNDEDKYAEEIDKIDDQNEKVLSDSLLALKSMKFQYSPYVIIQFKNSIDPPIPRSLLNYIIDNANHRILLKLYKTCKYFYIREKTLLCNFIYISQIYSRTFVKSACFANFEDFNSPNIRMFCSGTSLQLHCDKIPDLATKCLPKLCTCSLKCLVIGSQKLSVDEFKLLINGGKIEQADLQYTEIVKSDETILSIEELIKMLPNVVDILIRPTNEMYTFETAYELSKMDRNEKFESFKIYKIPEILELGLFEKFLKKNLMPKAILGLKVDNSVGDDFRQEMNIFFRMLSLHWEPIYEAPIFV
uniref:Uncharacterized protein n=1 Tax=Panagrolaimus davidi TaxID=227884 RepID=A0A914QSX3_9BILA